MHQTPAALPLTELHEAHDRTRLQLHAADVCVAELTIDAFDIHDGTGGQIAVRGIGNVETHEHYRHQGFARQLLAIALDHMRASGGSIGLLYGIDDFYDQLGWARCGDESHALLTVRELSRAHARETTMPEGYTSRRALPSDAPAIQALYAAASRHTLGANVRSDDCRAWTMLRDGLAAEAVRPGAAAGADARLVDDGDCRVVENAAGDIVAYAWRCTGHRNADELLPRHPNSMVIPEAIARDHDAARALLVDVRTWGEAWFTKDDAICRRIMLMPAPDSPLMDIIRTEQHAVLTTHLRPAGGMMALPLHDDAPVLTGAYQYLADRF